MMKLMMSYMLMKKNQRVKKIIMMKIKNKTLIKKKVVKNQN